MIKLLPQDVIKKIAAGEAIQSPFNIVKEMIENSLDARATRIKISVKDGGFKCIKVQDDGEGISEENLGLLCERHATSKISSAQDLYRLTSFGFRGEALASVSHVSQLTVVTSTEGLGIRLDLENRFNSRATYSQGKLVSKQPIACNKGTCMTVENIFYNYPHRQKTKAKAFTEEYSKILELCQVYSIYYHKIQFSCQKIGELVSDFNSLPTDSVIHSIESVMGRDCANSCGEIDQTKDSNTRLTGYVSRRGFKKCVFIFLVNGRWVSHSGLKQAIESTYALYLREFPFVFICLDIPGTLVDVNIHPSKTQILFSQEEELKRWICECIEREIKVNESIGVLSIPMLPNKKRERKEEKINENNENANNQNSQNSYGQSRVLFAPPALTIKSSFSSRTDPRERKIDSMKFNFDKKIDLSNVNAVPGVSKAGKSSTNVSTMVSDSFPNPSLNVFNSYPNPLSSSSSSFPNKLQIMSNSLSSPNILSTSLSSPDIPSNSFNSSNVPPSNQYSNSSPVIIQLDAIKRLKSSLSFDLETANTLRSSVLVGFLNHHLMLIQYLTRLYVFDYRIELKRLFYQSILELFGNFGKINLTTPLLIADEHVCSILERHSEMLEEYFSIRFENGLLLSLPLVFKGLVPEESELPEFLRRLVEVNWKQELPCFHDISIEIATYYSKTGNQQFIEHFLFAKMKEKGFKPKGGSLTLLTDLVQLYKVFERC